MDSARRIGRAVARLWVASRKDGNGRPVAKPGCEYGLVVEERLKALADSLDELKIVLRWLFFAVVGACIMLVLEVALRGVR